MSSLWYSKYLFNLELLNALNTGQLPVRLSNDKNGVYLVVFRNYKFKEENTLIYSYLFYSDLFTDLLLRYLITKTEFRNSIAFKEFGDFFTLIDNNLGSSDEIINYMKKDPNKFNEHLSNYQRDSNILEYINFINLLKKFVNIIDIKNMCYLLNSIYKKDSINFLCHLYKMSFFDNETCIVNCIKNVEENLNLLTKCLFVVKDLDIFINNVKEIVNKKVNQGPQSSRGETNSMNGFLDYLDYGFRDCLYKHHRYHFDRIGIKHEFCLSRKNFSIQNMRQNLGSPKFYSINRIIGKNK